jgi:hypothetical protein
MVDSPGEHASTGKPPGPAPPTREWAKITLEATPQGYRAFCIKLKAKIGPNLKATLRHAMLHEDFDPGDTRTENLHSLIYDEIVKGMDGHDALMIRMTDACGEFGPKCLDWLQKQLDPKDTASALATLMAIITEPIGAEVVKGVEAKIDLNNTLNSDLKLTDNVLAALVLTKMPVDLRHLRDIIVEKDELPTMENLLLKIKNAMLFATPTPTPPPVHSYAMMAAPSMRPELGKKKWVNCNSEHHVRVACDMPKADCKYCGPKAGHLSEHCFVGKTTVLPSYLSDERKADILAKREALKTAVVPASGSAWGSATQTLSIMAKAGDHRPYDIFDVPPVM